MKLNFEKTDGLIPCIVQDVRTRETLMLAYMNIEAWEITKQTKFATFYSRSRKQIWVKGESSGNRLEVREIRADCDLDAVLLLVENQGNGVCHEGFRSCFYRSAGTTDWERNQERVFDPAEVYR